jgi:hypothetical protein
MRKMALGMAVMVGVMLMAVGVFGQTNLTVVRHPDNTLWKMTCNRTNNCSAWTQFGGGFSTQPTLTWDPAINKYILIGIGNNGSNIWRSTFNEDGTWNNDWLLIGSGATGSPSPVAAAAGDFRFGTSTNLAAAGNGTTCTLGEIILTAGLVANGTPANGQILSIAQNQAMFSLLGTTYGGDGMTTFALPDLRGVAPNGLTYSICDQGVYPSRR